MKKTLLATIAVAHLLGAVLEEPAVSVDVEPVNAGVPRLPHGLGGRLQS